MFYDGYNISKDQFHFEAQCPLFGDQRTVKKITLPDNIFVWTAFIRSQVLIWKAGKQNHKMLYNNSKCQLLGNIQDGRIASLSIQSAEDTCFTINLQCNLTIQPMCIALDDTGIGMNIYEATTTSCEVQQSQITSIKQSTVMTSEIETQSEPDNAEWTSTYNSSSFGSVITLNGGTVYI
ncbi:Hypothetical predicted protein [Mytilus galloprovincialis]|uniref:Uncharacterized protein n=1 Tax=Mytilus galloprovincialis TaxID=29158 RepID=A0A8B6HM75_MYTGA|nr:Hypothetical predicted protein [Mytilus galloprovincialis]